MKDYIKKLNAEQYKAVTTLKGKVFILAGAGSGKTTVLTTRVAYMLDNDILPENILLLTFTNKAAKEMKTRIIKLTGDAAEKITATTFHSFCANLLRKHSTAIDIKPNYTIIDSPDMLDALSIAKETFLTEQKELGIEYSLKNFPSNKTIGMYYEAAVNNCASLKDILKEEKYKTEIYNIIKIFIKYKSDRNLLDYNDLLYYTEKLLRDDIDLRRKISGQFEYISCDEYQDTNTIQNKILNYLSEVHGNLAVVGDDNQSIYAFRYANIKNILDFDKTYPDCTTIILDTNYRSSQELLNFSNNMMSYAKEGKKKFLKGTFNGSLPELCITDDCYKEADFIISKILASEYNLKDIAVICRSARQSYILENKLNMLGVPYNKFGGLKFMEKVVVKDILAFLRVSVNFSDELAFFRLLQLYPGIGKKYAQQMSSEIALNGFDFIKDKYKKRIFAEYLTEIDNTIKYLKTLDVHEQTNFLIKEYYKKTMERCIKNKKTSEANKIEEYKKLEDDLEEATALCALTEKYISTATFLSDITLDATVDEDTDDKLNITTIHSAKGLEYNMVFIMDCIEGVTPRCSSADEEDPEELRCMYVAATRAKHELYLMAPRFYNIGYITGYLSHFINHPSVLSEIKILEYV